MVCFAALSVPVGVSAHLELTEPVSRYGGDVLKYGPCGVRDGERTENVTVFEPGETIEVRWNEYVDHPGHYRVAFDADGDDDFVDPATMMEFDSNEAVLLDGIEDGARELFEYAVTVTLPDVECERCTLQVIQVMYDKMPYTTPGNDIYYQCADLVLRAAEPGSDPDPDPNPPVDPEPPVEPGPDTMTPIEFDGAQADTAQGCAIGPMSAGVAETIGLLALMALLVDVRRRRNR